MSFRLQISILGLQMEPGGCAGLVPGGATADVQPLVPGYQAVLLTILHSPRTGRPVPSPHRESGQIDQRIICLSTKTRQ